MVLVFYVLKLVYLTDEVYIRRVKKFIDILHTIAHVFLVRSQYKVKADIRMYDIWPDISSNASNGYAVM